jgi:hypothetical protein
MTPRIQDLVVTHWGARFMGQNLPVSIGRGGIAQKVGETAHNHDYLKTKAKKSGHIL